MNAAEVIAACQQSGEPPFLVAGGFAVIAHGHPRTTFDLDFAVRHSDREAWIKRFLALGYQLFHEQSAFVQLSPPPGGVNVDLLLLNEQTFAGLWDKRVALLQGKVMAEMICLDHLLAMKLHALKHGRPHRYMRDLDDVIGLAIKHKLALESEPYRNLFLKYGNQEIYEKIRREIQRG